MYPREHDFDGLLWAAAKAEAARAGVTAAFLFALAKAHIAVESGFSPTAYHWDGPDPIRNVSRGIFQIEGATALAMGLPVGSDSDSAIGATAPRDYITSTVPGRRTGMYDPALAIPVGVHILADNLAATGGDLDKAIAAYNEGLPHALRDSYPYDNQSYVDKVNAKLPYFQGQAPPADPNEAGAGGVGTSPLGAGLVIVALAALAAWALAR